MSQTQQEIYVGGNIVEPSPAFQVIQQIKEGNVPSNRGMIDSLYEMEKTLGGHANEKKGSESRFAFDAQRLVRHAREILEEKNKDETLQSMAIHIKEANELLAKSAPIEKIPAHAQALSNFQSNQLQTLVDSFKRLCLSLGRNADFRVRMIEALQLFEQMLSDLTASALKVEEKIESCTSSSTSTSTSTSTSSQDSLSDSKTNFHLPSQTPFKVYLAEVLREDEIPESYEKKVQRTEEERQKRREKLRGILVELGNTSEYKELINNLSVFFQTNWAYLSPLLDETTADNKTMTALLVVVSDVQAVLERFSGNKSLSPLRNRIGALLVTFSRDAKIRELFGKWRDFFKKTIENPETQNVDSLDQQMNNLIETGKDLFKREKLQEDILFILKETRNLVERLRDETAFKTVGDDLDQLRKELLLNDEGKLDLMTLKQTLPTLKNVLIPTLTTTLKTVPIPTITVDNEKYFLQLSNLSLDARDFVPEKIRIHFTNDILFDFSTEGKDTFISKLTVLTRDFQALLRDLNFKYERKKVPKISDFGVADVEIVGVDIDIKWRMDMVGSTVTFYIDDIKCEINNVHTDVKEAHHKLLDNIYVRMFNSGLRKSVATSIENTLREKLLQFSIDTTKPLACPAEHCSSPQLCQRPDRLGRHSCWSLTFFRYFFLVKSFLMCVLFTEKVMESIERETSCKIKLDEKFIIVSGKDRLILRKGVDAVHKVKEDGEMKSSSVSHRSRSRSPRRTSVGPSRARNSEPQRQQLPSHGSSSFPERSGRQDKFVDNRFREETRVRENQRNVPRGSPQAYGSDRARSRSTHSKSPGRPRYSGWDKPYDRQKPEVSGYRSERWDQERMGGSSDIQVSHQFERPPFPQTLEELELEYTRDALELEKKRDKEEDEENNKHRETIRELRESYMKKLAGLRGMNAKQWDDFLQLDAQRRQQQARQQNSGLSYGNYRQFPPYAEFDDGYSSNPPPYGGNNMPMDSKGRYPNHGDNYSSRHQDNNYGGFQRQRREEYGKAYNRY